MESNNRCDCRTCKELAELRQAYETLQRRSTLNILELTRELDATNARLAVLEKRDSTNATQPLARS